MQLFNIGVIGGLICGSLTSAAVVDRRQLNLPGLLGTLQNITTVITGLTPVLSNITNLPVIVVPPIPAPTASSLQTLALPTLELQVPVLSLPSLGPLPTITVSPLPPLTAILQPIASEVSVGLLSAGLGVSSALQPAVSILNPIASGVSAVLAPVASGISSALAPLESALNITNLEPIIEGLGNIISTILSHNASTVAGALIPSSYAELEQDICNTFYNFVIGNQDFFAVLLNALETQSTSLAPLTGALKQYNVAVGNLGIIVIQSVPFCAVNVASELNSLLGTVGEALGLSS